MINPFNIFKGWFASKIYASEKAQILSKKRLLKCDSCKYAKQTKILKFINGGASEINTLICTGCSKHLHCPVVEKSLVKNETCPKKLWEL